jgi:hypothetical protein
MHHVAPLAAPLFNTGGLSTCRSCLDVGRGAYARGYSISSGVDPMLHVFGFDRVAVAVGDLYFVDPEPLEGQEGHEHGVRLELRRLERGELPGTIYSAQPIALGAPIWRVDLFESTDGPVGSFDRTHHHPTFDGWEPEPRCFEPDLSADPLGWLVGRLCDLDGVLTASGIDPAEVGPGDPQAVRRAASQIVAVVRTSLEQVRTGELAMPPAGPVDDLVGVRVGWL